LLEYVESNASFSDLEDIYSFFRKVEEIQSRKSNISLEELLEKFELHKKYNLIIPKQVMKQWNAQIEILTAHGSKWLEYDFVYIPGLYSWNWESKRMIDKLKLPLWISWDGLQFSDLDEKDAKSIEKETQSQEDRRLFFVALTRAKKKLTLSRPAGKNNKPYIDSPFVLEIWMDTHVQETQVTEENQAASMKSILLWEGLVNISDDELDYISDFLENYKLSPTDLNTFLEDPHMFLRNVVFKYPFDGNEFTIFWNVYHKVLEEFTNQKQNGIDISLWMMTERFLQLLGKQVLTAEEQKRLEKKWIEWLTGYFEHFSSNQRQVLDVEYNFRPRNIVFEDIPITGKIDKIEKVEDVLWGAETQWQIWLFSSSVALVDYKTGSTKTLWTIKWEDRYGNKKEDMSQGKYYRQLLFYKLLAENDPEFTKEYQIWELALDFVEGKNGDYKYVPVEYSEEDFEVFRKLVKDSWKKINDLKFWKEVLGK
jgi:DNA helicase-2/ATP-dependent DNA helicase PcrA